MTEVGESPASLQAPEPPASMPAAPAPVSSPVQDEGESDPTALTPIRAHYLKKALIQLQFSRELEGIASTPSPNISTLSYLGPPFTPPPKGGPFIELPLLRYFFRQFVLTFPFLNGAPKDFFPEKVQPFIASLVARNLYPLTPLDDDAEGSNHPKQPNVLAKLERHFSLFVNYALKLVEPEQVVRLKQSDLDRIELLARKRAARLAKLKDTFDVNVVCVRTVTEKGRVRSRVHEVRRLQLDDYGLDEITSNRNSSSVLVALDNQTSSSRVDMAISRHLRRRSVCLFIFITFVL